MRFRVVRIPGDSAPGSQYQASLEPYARALFDAGFVDVGLVMNVDEPLGPFFDKGAVWGLRVGGGARF